MLYMVIENYRQGALPRVRAQPNVAACCRRGFTTAKAGSTPGASIAASS